VRRWNENRRKKVNRVKAKKKSPISAHRKKAPDVSAEGAIRRLPTGARGLDEILGGGIPEFSFNLIGGQPGCGKTTLAHQIAFANATPKKPALYFTALGETVIKMLRYQRQFSFFDVARLGKEILFSNLSDAVIERDMDKLLDQIITEVTAADPGIVVIDSFRTLVRESMGEADEIKMQSFFHRLAEFLMNWETTTFLLGEYSEADIGNNPIFTLVDGIFWLSQVAERNSVVRKLQLVKLRGQASVPGLHTIRIDSNGLEAFSRTLGLAANKVAPALRRRLSIGIPRLDEMLGGGVLEGDSLLVAGPSGTGKSALATQFVAEGLRNGEPGIMAIFEERPLGYTQRASTFGLKLEAAQRKGLLEILYLRPLDLSVDETMQEILDAIKRTGARRLTIDSLVGFEMALAPSFRADFRESLYRMIGALTGAGVTILSTVEIEDSFTGLPFSHYAISFLTDDIIRLRYLEIDGQLRKVMMVVKMRGSNHSKDIREYVISDKGVVVIHPRRTDYHGLITGIPARTGPRTAQDNEAAPEPKATR
jgi:circadian clock protein KaiC